MVQAEVEDEGLLAPEVTAAMAAELAQEDVIVCARAGLRMVRPGNFSAISHNAHRPVPGGGDDDHDWRNGCH